MFRQHRNANAAPRGRRARPRRRTRPPWLSGTLVTLDPQRERIVVRVEDAGRPELRTGSEVTVDTRGCRLDVSDGDGDGRPSLTDLFPGDRIRVELIDAEGTPPAARRIEQRGPRGPVGGLRRLWQT